MGMMRCDSVRYLGVRADNGADGSRCWLERCEALRVVRRRGGPDPPGGPSHAHGELRSVARARWHDHHRTPDPILTGVHPVTVGVRVAGASPTFGIPTADHDAGALSSGDSEHGLVVVLLEGAVETAPLIIVTSWRGF